ncbi:BrnT family toxin [Phenylobacterium sp.]|uniref:BrnT family toxin n=1 Tax=Phenylobacterium sp. TaxID=1871053 RepID=UPI0038621B64
MFVQEHLGRDAKRALAKNLFHGDPRAFDHRPAVHDAWICLDPVVLHAAILAQSPRGGNLCLARRCVNDGGSRPCQRPSKARKYAASAPFSPILDFDPDKSAANLAKHGIDFEAAQTLWDDDLRLVVDARFLSERRELVVGRIGQRLWTAAVTFRGDAIRIISVRRARNDEVRRYELQDD